MPTIPPTSSGNGLNSLAVVTPAKSMLDKDSFLKLFVAQLQHQDPNSPMDTNDSMQQMSSFSMVEQITNMAMQSTKIADAMHTSSSVDLIGRTVTYLDAAKVEQTGIVERVATKDGKASLTVAGRSGIDPTSISQVA